LEDEAERLRKSLVLQLIRDVAEGEPERFFDLAGEKQPSGFFDR
jgi:hypothetical protein